MRKAAWGMFLSAVLLLGIAVRFSSWGATHPVPQLPPLPAIKAPRNQVPITLVASLPDVPARLPVYRLVYPQSDRAYVQRLSQAMGVKGEPVSAAGGWAAGEGGRTVQVFDQTGAFWYRDQERLWKKGTAGPLPEQASAVAWASAFLEAHDLLVDGMVYDGIGHTELTEYDVATGQETVTRTDMHVNYKLMVAGVPVAGPGGVIKVYLGQGHRLLGLYWATFALQPESSKALLAPQAALARLEAEGVAATIKGASVALVHDLALVYYAGPGDQPQTHLVPVYQIRGVIRGDGEERDFVQYMPAVADNAWQPALPQGLSEPTGSARR